MRSAYLYTAAILAWALLFCTLSSSAQSNADWEWIGDHFPQALNDLLPLERSGVYVAYRSHRDFYTDTLEYSFVLAPDLSAQRSGSVRRYAAHVLQADSFSIHDQMMVLHRKSPNRSVESIEKEIRRKASTLTEADCPAVRTQVVRFQQLQLAPPQFDAVVLHPLIHEFHVRAGMGDMDIVLYAGDNSFVQWALETRHELEVCAANSR